MHAATDRKILVINCGSSSLKYEVWQMPQRVSLGRGLVERIGELKGRITQKTPRGELRARGAGAAPQGGHGAGPRGAHGPGEGHPGEPGGDRGRRPPRGARRRAVRRLRGHRRGRAEGHREERGARAAAQPAEPHRHPEAQAVLPGREAGGRLRHRVPPDHAPGRLPLRPALRAVREVQDPPLRLPRHQPPLRRRAAPWSC